MWSKEGMCGTRSTDLAIIDDKSNNVLNIVREVLGNVHCFHMLMINVIKRYCYEEIKINIHVYCLNKNVKTMAVFFSLMKEL